MQWSVRPYKPEQHVVEIKFHISFNLDHGRGSVAIHFYKTKWWLFQILIAQILVIKSESNIATFCWHLKKSWKSSDSMSLLYENQIEKNLFQKNSSNIDF